MTLKIVTAFWPIVAVILFGYSVVRFFDTKAGRKIPAPFQPLLAICAALLWAFVMTYVFHVKAPPDCAMSPGDPACLDLFR